MTTYEFHPEVEDAHFALDVDDWDAVYVVGDVHGCIRPLESLLRKDGRGRKYRATNRAVALVTVLDGSVGDA